MELDQVLGIATGAIEPSIERFWIGLCQGGDDEAVIEAEGCVRSSV
jgi:hypothetical protein